jgi:hypothetical protein
MLTFKLAPARKSCYIKTRTLLCLFLVQPLAGFAGQRLHQQKVLRGGFAAPQPTNCTLAAASTIALALGSVKLYSIGAGF